MALTAFDIGSGVGEALPSGVSGSAARWPTLALNPLAQSPRQVQVALGGKEFLYQAVGRSEEDGVAGSHQAVAQGTPGVGLAGAGQSEGQHVDAALHEAALGQMIQLLAQRQGDPVVLEEPAPVKTGVSQVLPEGSLDSRRSRLMRRWRRSSASCSSTSKKVGRASPWPAAVKRCTDWAPAVGSLN